MAEHLILCFASFTYANSSALTLAWGKVMQPRHLHQLRVVGFKVNRVALLSETTCRE
jgi:hypothetical protein